MIHETNTVESLEARLGLLGLFIHIIVSKRTMSWIPNLRFIEPVPTYKLLYIKNSKLETTVNTNHV